MSASEVNVRLESDDPLAVLTIVDSRYAVRATGIRVLEKTLPPGLYLARSRSGDVSDQRTLRLSADAEGVQVIRFRAIGALQSSASSYALAVPEISATARAAATAHAPIGDSWIFLALRQRGPRGLSTENAPDVNVRIERAKGFALCTLDGDLVDDLGSVPLSRVASGHDAIATGVPAGWYSLAIPISDERTALLPICIRPEWSPSIFIELRTDSLGRPRPDIDRLLLSYDHREWAVYQFSARLRAIELARRSLLLAENLLTSALMNVLVEQKFRDPMLGLFAAHLLLLGERSKKSGRPERSNKTDVGDHKDKTIDFDKLSIVLNNMAEMLGEDFPDLVILRTQARKMGAEGVVHYNADRRALVAPPMLLASWNILVKLPERREEVAQFRGRLRGIARAKLQSDTWLVWNREAYIQERKVSTEESLLKTSEKVTKPRRLKGLFAVTSYDGVTTALETPRAGRARSAASSTDELLGNLLGQVRRRGTTAGAPDELLRSFDSTSPLERVVLRACIQLSHSETRDQRVPNGYAKRLAATLQVPMSLLRESIQHVSARLLKSSTEPNGRF